MKGYILKRLLEMIPVVLSVILIVFSIMHIVPGDIALVLAGEVPDPQYIESVREQYGLNKPLHQQLFIYLSKIIRGDLGNSWIYGKPVISVILDHLPATLLLVATSWVFSILVGTLLGVFAGKNQGGRIDTVISAIGLVTYSIPTFWLGLIFILVFSLNLGLFPTGGMLTLTKETTGFARILDILWHLILPATTLTFFWLGQYIRLARSSIIDVAHESYITTARAIGFNERIIYLKYALKNAIIPTVTIAGIHLGFIFAGAILTETVFGWPGMGRLIYRGIVSRDNPLIIGCYIIVSLCVVFSILLTDILYAYLDPRIKY